MTIPPDGFPALAIHGTTGAAPGDRPMARHYSSLGLFAMFGRSADLRQLDQALRAVDLHPKLVPEAVKLTVCALLKEQAGGSEPSPDVYRSAAEIVAYCMIGPEAFADSNDAAATLAVEQRIEEALVSGDSLDAQLVLLTLHARVIQPSVIERYQLESSAAERDASSGR